MRTIKKSIVLLLILVSILSSCKKEKKEDLPNGVLAIYVNLLHDTYYTTTGETISLANTQENLDNNIFIAEKLIGENNKTIFQDLEKGKYFFKSTIIKDGISYTKSDSQEIVNNDDWLVLQLYLE